MPVPGNLIDSFTININREGLSLDVSGLQFSGLVWYNHAP